MDRLGGLGQPLPFLPRKEDPAVKKGRRSPETTKTGFLSFLGKAETSDTSPLSDTTAAGQVTEAQLEKLLDEVYSTGQDLVRNPSPENVIAYKKSVGRFIRTVVDGSMDVAEIEGRKRFSKDGTVNRQAKYSVLHVVDEKLEKLGAYVLSNQKDKLEILRKVDELQGLLVDLRH